MSKSDRKNKGKKPPLYYIATVVMILALAGFLYFVGKNVIPYFQATKLEHEIPKPQFNASVQQPVTFSVLSAQATATPAPEDEVKKPDLEASETVKPEEQTPAPEPEEEPVSVEKVPDRPLTKAEERVQAIMKEAEEKAFSKKDEETVFEDEDAPINEAFKELLEMNPDTVGWLTVGEIADYPVVRRDNEFYLTHNFKGDYDPNGTIFVTQDNVLRPRDTVLLLFGHHMNSGKMFGKLVKYMHADYVSKFPLVEFHTIYADEEKHEAWYVPISFFSASMIEDEVGYFDVLPMFFLNEESHQTYLDTITARSVWKAPTDVTTDDKLIMLITCSYDLDDSRYLLICRQLREDETPEEMEKLYKDWNP